MNTQQDTLTARLLVGDNVPEGDPPAWEITNAWGGQVAVCMPYALPAPPEIPYTTSDAAYYARLFAAAPLLRDELVWAVEWMERYEGEVMPEWREWQERGRAALSAATPPPAGGGVVLP